MRETPAPLHQRLQVLEARSELDVLDSLAHSSLGTSNPCFCTRALFIKAVPHLLLASCGLRRGASAGAGRSAAGGRVRCWRACAVRCGRCCGLRALQGGLQHCHRVVECLRLLAVMMLNVQVLKLLFPVRVHFTCVSEPLRHNELGGVFQMLPCQLSPTLVEGAVWVALAVPCRAVQ